MKCRTKRCVHKNVQNEFRIWLGPIGSIDQWPTVAIAVDPADYYIDISIFMLIRHYLSHIYTIESAIGHRFVLHNNNTTPWSAHIDI